MAAGAAAQAAPTATIRLEPRQVAAFTSSATEVLYGGAAGGGKSYLLRTSAIRWCVEVPGIQVYLFRRTLPDLRDNHLRGPTSFHVMLEPYISSGHVRYRAVENEFAFWNGSVLHLCYCDSENDVEKYRGAEIHVLMPDELTHFSEYQYRFLRSRVRIAGLAMPEKYKAVLPRIEAASNPGSIGHAWVKRTFIAPKPANEAWQVPPEEGGMVRQFIPARLADNPYLTRDDPHYADRLRGLGADNLVRAMLDGDWDIVAGQAFEKLRRDVHCIEPFEPPEDWLCFGSFDWGSTRPFSFGMWTVANGNALPDGRIYRRGAIIRYNEVYGWNGKPNEGLRKEAEDVAEMLRSRIGGRKMAYIVADPSMWKVDGGPSIAETMLRKGIVLRKADNSRIVGYTQLRQRIAGDEDGPMLYVTKNCHDGFWRTMPDLVMDDKHVEDVDTDQEDHCLAVGTRTALGVVGVAGPVINHTGIVWGEATKRRMAETVRLTFDDGEQLVCTRDHRFLTGGGWVEAKDLMDEVCYNVFSEWRTQWLKSLAQRFRNFSAFVTTSADTTSSEKAFAFTAPYGSTSTGQYLMDGTFTTKTKTEPTTSPKISNLCKPTHTYHSTARKPTTQKGLSQHARPQESGTVQKKGLLGTPSRLRKLGRRFAMIACTRTARFAVRATRYIGLTRTSLCIAALTAVRRQCVGVEQNGKAEVTCLNVPVGNAFALESGTLVHNCYDDARYAAMSRSWTGAVKKDKPKVDRWMRAFERPTEESWRTA